MVAALCQTFLFYTVFSNLDLIFSVTVRSIQALELAKHDLPLRRLILVESPHLDYAAWPYFRELYKVVKRSNARRPTSWASKEDAMSWIKTHIPWKSFHPDVLQIISVRFALPSSDVSLLCVSLNVRVFKR